MTCMSDSWLRYPDEEWFDGVSVFVVVVVVTAVPLSDVASQIVEKESYRKAKFKDTVSLYYCTKSQRACF